MDSCPGNVDGKSRRQEKLSIAYFVFWATLVFAGMLLVFFLPLEGRS